jgi:hypothetical protein
VIVGVGLRRLGLLFPTPAPVNATHAARDALGGHEHQAWEVAKELIRMRDGRNELPGYNWSGHVTYRAGGHYICEVPVGAGHFSIRLLLAGPPDDIKSWSVASYTPPK